MVLKPIAFSGGTVIGGVEVASKASELSCLIAIAVENRLTVDQVARTFAVYPSISTSTLMLLVLCTCQICRNIHKSQYLWNFPYSKIHGVFGIIEFRNIQSHAKSMASIIVRDHISLTHLIKNTDPVSKP